jgi:Holliday junction DNA helicase RuvA
VIASLNGKLEATGTDWAIVDVNGVGFRVFMPTSTLSTFGRPGSTIHLYTHLHVREDNLALYGFSTFEELGIFQTLTGVSGIGPKLALAMLSAMTADHLVSVIASGNTDMLTTVPGIGKKIAARLVLELKDKIGAMATVVPLQMIEGSNDVIAALVSLGYSTAEANRAVAGLPDSALSLEDKIRLALAYFVQK